jgi:hypothetical protein
VSEAEREDRVVADASATTARDPLAYVLVPAVITEIGVDQFIAQFADRSRSHSCVVFYVRLEDGRLVRVDARVLEPQMAPIVGCAFEAPDSRGPRRLPAAPRRSPPRKPRRADDPCGTCGHRRGKHDLNQAGGCRLVGCGCGRYAHVRKVKRASDRAC